MPGPIGKRSDQKHGHRDHNAGVLKAPAGPRVDPGEPDDCWADIAKSMWNAMKISGQSEFYEATDWEYARFVCECMSRNLQQGRSMSAVLMANVLSGLGDLLVTEGNRRRVKMELQRGNVTDTDAEEADVMTLEYQRGAGLANTA